MTPFHFGYALPWVFLDPKKRRIDLVAMLGGSVIVDVHAIFIFLFHFNQPLHGPVHSFLIASVLGIVLGVTLHFTQPFWDLLLRVLHYPQHTTIGAKIGATLSMAWLHIIVDAGIYPEMHPFWPFLQGNPLYGWISPALSYWLGGIGIVAGLILYGFVITVHLQHEDKMPFKGSDSAFYSQFSIQSTDSNEKKPT